MARALFRHGFKSKVGVIHLSEGWPRVSDKEMLEALNRIEASNNRTTYAVRAFVRFLFIQLSATTIGSMLAAAAAALGIAWLAVLGGLVTTGGLFWAGFAGRAELRKSNPNGKAGGPRLPFSRS